MNSNLKLLAALISIGVSISSNAADMDILSTISAVQLADKDCVQGAPKLKITDIKIGTASDRNSVQTDNGWKRDGIKGKNYLILITNNAGKQVAVASHGPIVQNATRNDFLVLLKNKICMVDES